MYFRYDADGRRTKITEASGGTSVSTELRYADGRISAEYSTTCDIINGCSTPVLAREYVTDESGAIVKMVIPSGQANSGTYLVTWNGHGDALNVLHLAGGTVSLANSFTYDTWGAATVHTHNGFADLGFRYRYVGQFGVQDDGVHGLPFLLMGARHYAPEFARFLQPDPAGLEENLYAYAGSNPVSRVDPTGTLWFLVGMAAAALVRMVARFTIATVVFWLRGCQRSDWLRIGPTQVSNQLIYGPGVRGSTSVWAIKGGGKSTRNPKCNLPFHYHIHIYNWNKPSLWFRYTPILPLKR